MIYTHSMKSGARIRSSSSTMILSVLSTLMAVNRAKRKCLLECNT